MKKRKIVYIGIFLLGVVTYMIISGALSNSYLRTIRINWGIDLPKNCTEVFRADSGASFHGDGERYHVFQYKKETDLGFTLTDSRIPENEAEEIRTIVEPLGIPSAYAPDFGQPFSVLKMRGRDDGRNVLFLLFDGKTDKLYVIEDFY